MKTVGVDLDGTITPHGYRNPNIKLPWWMFYLLVPFVTSAKPRKEMVQKMKKMRGQGYKFVIVTSRPNQFFQLTRKWLLLHRVPFNDLFCVGPGKGTNERKIRVISSEKMETYIDMNEKVVKFMIENSVNAAKSLDNLN